MTPNTNHPQRLGGSDALGGALAVPQFLVRKSIGLTLAAAVASASA